jgi:hypothetical protein
VLEVRRGSVWGQKHVFEAAVICLLSPDLIEVFVARKASMPMLGHTILTRMTAGYDRLTFLATWPGLILEKTSRGAESCKW